MMSYNILTNNCHAFVAHCLNLQSYNGRQNWEMASAAAPLPRRCAPAVRAPSPPGAAGGCTQPRGVRGPPSGSIAPSPARPPLSARPAPGVAGGADLLPRPLRQPRRGRQDVAAVPPAPRRRAPLRRGARPPLLALLRRCAAAATAAGVVNAPHIPLPSHLSARRTTNLIPRHLPPPPHCSPARRVVSLLYFRGALSARPPAADASGEGGGEGAAGGGGRDRGEADAAGGGGDRGGAGGVRAEAVLRPPPLTTRLMRKHAWGGFIVFGEAKGRSPSAAPLRQRCRVLHAAAQSCSPGCWPPARPLTVVARCAHAAPRCCEEVAFCGKLRPPHLAQLSGGG